jgi:hypothetical protein
MLEHYTLYASKLQALTKLALSANDANHAQAQALDIARSLRVTKFELVYKKSHQTKLSELFRKLAFSDFKHQECFKWSDSFIKNLPVLYTLGSRYYVRPLILDYMDMNRDNFVRMSCNCSSCINPYHNGYKAKKASKLSGGDLKMVVAYRSQGISVPQIAEALNVHRSTIYRNLTNERFSSRTEDHRSS